MNPPSRAWASVVLFSLFASLPLCAQTKTKDTSSKHSTVLQGTPVPRPPVASQDPIVKLDTFSPAYTHDVVSKKPELFPETAAAPEPVAPADDLASLQRLLKVKQQNLELLMHMFADDERKFLTDTSGKLETADLQEKRKYEQQELHRAALEIAQLRSRIDQLSHPLSVVATTN